MIFSKLPRKEKIGFIGIIIIVFLFFLAKLVISPITRKIRSINTEIKINIKQLEHSLWNLSQKEEITKEMISDVTEQDKQFLIENNYMDEFQELL